RTPPPTRTTPPLPFPNPPLPPPTPPAAKTPYVTTHGPGPPFPDSVTPIRTATNKVLRPIHLGGCPVAIAITPNGKTAYVADSSKTAHGSEKSQVTPIPTATNTTLPPPKLTQNPQAHTVAPDSTQTCKN